MNWEPDIVKTVDLGYEQLMLIESRGAPVCVIFRGVLLVGRGCARNGYAKP